MIKRGRKGSESTESLLSIDLPTDWDIPVEAHWDWDPVYEGTYDLTAFFGDTLDDGMPSTAATVFDVQI